MAIAKITPKLEIYDLFPYLLGIIYFLIGMILIITFIYFHNSIVPLANSINTPWGIFTSIFVYDGPGNIEAYFLILIFLSISCLAYRFETRKRRYLVTIYSMFLGGLIANGIWLYEMLVQNNNITSAGQSGVVYAFWGACFAIFLIDSILIIIGLFSRKIVKKKPILHYLKSVNRRSRWIGGGFSLFGSIVFLADLYDGQVTFFSEYSHINVIVHIYGFISGALLAGILYLYSLYSLSKKEAKGANIADQGK